MRFALAVAAGALVVAMAFMRIPSSDPLLVVAVVVLAGLRADFFAVRRGALAGFLLVYVANIVFVIINSIQLGIPQGDGGIVGFAGRALIVQFVLLQFAIPAALAGWLGAHLRHRLVRRWR